MYTISLSDHMEILTLLKQDKNRFIKRCVVAQYIIILWSTRIVDTSRCKKQMQCKSWINVHMLHIYIYVYINICLKQKWFSTHVYSIQTCSLGKIELSGMKWNVMIDVLSHESALSGWTGPGTTCTHQENCQK